MSSRGAQALNHTYRTGLAQISTVAKRASETIPGISEFFWKALKELEGAQRQVCAHPPASPLYIASESQGKNFKW